jgi:hypothetical protein
VSDIQPEWLEATDGSLAAVLDASHDPDILLWLRQQDRPHLCLFAPPASETLAAYAPYVISLDTAGLRDLAEYVAGKPWAIYVAHRGTLQKLALHLKSHLMVRSPSGRPAYFRFFDPRVLRAYLPTCNRSQLQRFFGADIEAVYAVGPAPREILQFRRPPAWPPFVTPRFPTRRWTAATPAGALVDG